MRILIALLLLTAVASPATGVLPTVALLTCWVGWLLWTLPEQPVLVLPSPLIRFAIGLCLLTAAEAWAWRPERDMGDVVQLLLFFSIVPAMAVVGTMNRRRHLDEISAGALAAFWAMTLAIAGWIAFEGIDWDRNTFFHPLLHKNGVSAAYEVLAFLAVASRRREGKSWLPLAVIAIIALVMVGSKTGLVVTLLFLVGLVARWAFVVAAIPVAVVGTFLLTQLTADSPLRTASQRLVTWLQAWLEITESSRTIFFGNGPGTFISAIDFQGLEGIAGTHNLVLQILHNFGVLGLALFGAYFLWVWRAGRGLYSVPALSAVWLFNAHAFFDVGWVVGAGTVASVILGLGLAEATGVPVASDLERESSSASPS